VSAVALPGLSIKRFHQTPKLGHSGIVRHAQDLRARKSPVCVSQPGMAMPLAAQPEFGAIKGRLIAISTPARPCRGLGHDRRLQAACVEDRNRWRRTLGYEALDMATSVLAKARRRGDRRPLSPATSDQRAATRMPDRRIASKRYRGGGQLGVALRTLIPSNHADLFARSLSTSNDFNRSGAPTRVRVAAARCHKYRAPIEKMWAS